MKKVFVLFMLLMPFLYTANVKAQSDTGNTDKTDETDVHVPEADFRGKGVDISTLEFNPDGTLNGRVLLYNVAKDMFLNAGGHWGTRAATYTVGLPIQIIKNTVTETKTENGATTTTTKTVYKLRGPFNNEEQAGSSRTGNYIGVVRDDEGKGKGVYYDRGTYHGTNWVFERVEKPEFEGDFVYQICMGNSYNPGTDFNYEYQNKGKVSPDRKLVANQKMEIGVFKNGNMNLVSALTVPNITEEKEKYSYWKIVRLKEIVEDFNTTYDTRHPSDASFLMRAQNFNRMNRFNDALTSGVNDGRGWYKDGNIKFYYGLKTGVTGYVQDLDETYGMFYCGGIRGGNKDERLYQNIKIPYNGWYRIDCQGYFSNSDNPDKCFAQLYARLKSSDKLNTSGYASVNLLPKSYGEPYNGAELSSTDNNNTYLPSFMKGDKKITNKLEAGVAFYNQLYPNHILIYVNSEDADENGLIPTAKIPELELGIKLTENMKTGQFVLFDDFQVKYLGESFALDETLDDFHNGMGEADNEAMYKNRVMILRRTLTTDKWNSICLPVDLTKEQLNTAFFPNPMLAKLRDSQHYGTMEFQTVDFSKIKNDEVALHKGQCYLIKPGYGGRVGEGSIEIGNANNVEITAPYYTIDRVTLRKADVEGSLGLASTDKDNVLKKIQDTKDVNGTDKDFYTVVGNDVDEEGKIYKDCQLRVFGTFEKKTDKNGTDNRVPANSYTFVDGKLYHLSDNYTQKGFSCWIEDNHQIGGSAKAHKLSFATYIDGVSDGTTTIEGFTVDMREGQAQGIYTIYGQLVGKDAASAEGLPQGIYIVNGKKVVVR